MELYFSGMASKVQGSHVPGLFVLIPAHFSGTLILFWSVFKTLDNTHNQKWLIPYPMAWWFIENNNNSFGPRAHTGSGSILSLAPKEKCPLHAELSPYSPHIPIKPNNNIRIWKMDPIWLR